MSVREEKEIENKILSLKDRVEKYKEDKANCAVWIEEAKIDALNWVLKKEGHATL